MLKPFRVLLFYPNLSLCGNNCSNLPYKACPKEASHSSLQPLVWHPLGLAFSQSPNNQDMAQGSCFYYEARVGAFSALLTLVALNGLGDTPMPFEARISAAYGVATFARKMTVENLIIKDCHIIYRDLEGTPRAVLRVGSWQNNLVDVTLDRIFIGLKCADQADMYQGSIQGALNSVDSLLEFLEHKRRDGRHALLEPGRRTVQELAAFITEDDRSNRIQNTGGSMEPLALPYQVSCPWLTVSRLFFIRRKFMEVFRNSADLPLYKDICLSLLNLETCIDDHIIDNMEMYSVFGDIVSIQIKVGELETMPVTLAEASYAFNAAASNQMTFLHSEFLTCDLISGDGKKRSKCPFKEIWETFWSTSR